jgi:hypothetical protein
MAGLWLISEVFSTFSGRFSIFGPRFSKNSGHFMGQKP